MPLLLADFIHIKVCKPNLRKTLDTTDLVAARWNMYVTELNAMDIVERIKIEVRQKNWLESIRKQQECKQSSKIQKFSPENAEFFGVNFLL